MFAAVPFNCNRAIPLQTAIDFSLPGETLELSGTCSGPVVVTAKNLTLRSTAGAVLDGGGKDVLTVNGAIRAPRLRLATRHHGLTIISGSHMVAFSAHLIQHNGLFRCARGHNG